MNARMLPPRVRLACAGVVLALISSQSGCGLTSKHEERKIPHYGIVDPSLPRELRMVSHPPYVIEPPDELEVSVRPAALDIPLTNLVVQADGNLDFGFIGDVYVAGLTLAEAELKIA